VARITGEKWGSLQSATAVLTVAIHFGPQNNSAPKENGRNLVTSQDMTQKSVAYVGDVFSAVILEPFILMEPQQSEKAGK